MIKRAIIRLCVTLALLLPVILWVEPAQTTGRGHSHIVLRHQVKAFVHRLERLDRQGLLEQRYGISRIDLQQLREYLQESQELPDPSELPPGVGGLSIPPLVRQDKVSIRTEPDLGRPSRLEDDPAEGPWLRTQATQFVNIKKTAFFRGNNSITNGIQMSGSFVAETATRVAIHFAAEACVGEHPASAVPPDNCGDTSDTNRRMFVRALVDGVPIEPGDVVFAVGHDEGVRAFLFYHNRGRWHPHRTNAVAGRSTGWCRLQ